MNRFVLWSFISDSWQYNPWLTDNKMHLLTMNRAPMKSLRLTMEEWLLNYLIDSLNKGLLSDKYTPGTIPGGGDKTMNKTESYLSWREIGDEQVYERDHVRCWEVFWELIGVVLLSAWWPWIECLEKVTLKFGEMNGKEEPAEMGGIIQGEARVSPRDPQRAEATSSGLSLNKRPCPLVMVRKTVTM